MTQILPKTQILSAVIVVDKRDDGKFLAVQEVAKEIADLNLCHEIVVVVNRYYAKSDSEALKVLTTKFDNLQIYLLKNVIDYKEAVLAGIENSIGDWVLTIDVYQDDAFAIKRMMETAFRENVEVVIGLDKKLENSLLTRFLSFAFNFVFRKLHGYDLSRENSSLKLLSRAVTNYILQHDSPLIAVETISAKSNIKKSFFTQKTKINNLSLKERINNRWMVLIGINSAPLRLANFISGAGALLSLTYSVYVVLVNLIKNDVIAGWTTVSLILSMMFLTMSTVLWLISEYLVMLSNPNSRKANYEIIERLSSNLQARNNFVNVEVENAKNEVEESSDRVHGLRRQ